MKDDANRRRFMGKNGIGMEEPEEERVGRNI
jgi:hypothetical protein